MNEDEKHAWKMRVKEQMEAFVVTLLYEKSSEDYPIRDDEVMEVRRLLNKAISVAEVARGFQDLP